MLREYLVEGRSVRDLAAEHAVEPVAVRVALAGVGIKVDPGDVRDPVCAAVGWLGYKSFAEYVRDRGLAPRADQARELAVSESALQRIYVIFEELALTESGVDDPTA